MTRASDEDLGLRPLTARSVLASMLLGTHPPVLPASVLVASARLFGVSDSAARTALSRLVAAGQLEVDDGRYRLTEVLADRQRRQDAGRSARRRRWDGAWTIVVLDRRPVPAAARARRRVELARARLAEVRDGVWARPDNLDLDLDLDLLVPRSVAGTAGTFHPLGSSSEAWEVAELWDLDGWQRRARGLMVEVDELAPGLEAGDDGLLARGFVVSAAVLRLFHNDPLLPDELLPDDWAGTDLRWAYDRFDEAYRSLLRSWFRRHRDS